MAIRQDIRILIVDDFPMFLRMMRELLVEEGFRCVEEATNGVEALQMLRDNCDGYDLVISDWHMKPLDGFDLLKIVREDAKLGHIPFVMMSAEFSAERVDAALAAGASSFLPKPFSMADLEDAIASALKDLDSPCDEIVHLEENGVKIASAPTAIDAESNCA